MLYDRTIYWFRDDHNSANQMSKYTNIICEELKKFDKDNPFLVSDLIQMCLDASGLDWVDVLQGFFEAIEALWYRGTLVLARNPEPELEHNAIQNCLMKIPK